MRLSSSFQKQTYGKNNLTAKDVYNLTIQQQVTNIFAKARLKEVIEH